MDFSKLGNISKSSRPTNPIEIFEKLPNLPGTPNDIWRGQNEALQQWDKNRKLNDILIALNTGAGKTLAGLLIAQSLINEGIENVMYVCSTKDLVEQTSREAQKVGIDHTTRLSGTHSNSLFESGKSFCITTYQTVLNGLKGFIQKFPPGAVIFDDAHVAESMIRDAFLINITYENHQKCYSELIELFTPHFSELNRRQQFKAAVSGERQLTMMAAPSGVRERSTQIATILQKFNIPNDTNLKYKFPNLEDHISECCVLFSKGQIEITPPFLPSLCIDIFERPIRRVYLSATLKNKSDFIRAFGRKPDLSIEPKNDAGNGERLVLFANDVEKGFTVSLANEIASNNKIIVAVPSYAAAEAWGTFSSPPSRDQFTQMLNSFREAKTGKFLLVSRVDGIDLPHDTCRIMLMDGLPTGSTLIEKYQSDFLNMRKSYSSRIANRLVQLFGRINRGRNDYGVFLISSSNLNAWLSNDRNIALLPNLLQQQILLGRHVQAGMSINNHKSLNIIVKSVLGRDQSWLEYYGSNIERNEIDEDHRNKADDSMEPSHKVAEAEAKIASALWNGDSDKARLLIEESLETTTRLDPLLAGWHNILLGGLYEKAGDLESADVAYENARMKLGTNVLLPTHKKFARTSNEPVDPFAANIFSIASLSSAETYKKELNTLRNRLKHLDGGTSSQMEEAVRSLGELLGFSASRPDNDSGTGPDVLWEELSTLKAIAIELKTDKKDPATYNKKDVGQSHDHIQWVSDHKKDVTLIGLLFVGPSGKSTNQANPSNQMWVVNPTQLVTIREEILSIIVDIRSLTPLEKLEKSRVLCNGPKWMIQALFDNIEKKALLK
ncbi:DEAD/DEAH box helicase family protein [Methylobacterium marchantiae]|uniref:DEAD/DEAH box helicase family protein n=1 Tax=Methylobacterium marchantiae TaxID=600331 RepID=A0ABW3X3R4_9HYPH|nr:hypothetical protein AIGOOFII_0257 [Methylobacterium marchantiae]